MRTTTAIGVGVAVAAVAAAAVTAVLNLPMAADEEAPIIVKNGTLEILAGTGIDNQWDWVNEANGDNENSQPSFSHEPSKKYRDRSKTHWVKLVQPSGACVPDRQTAKGALVVVTYKYDNGNKTKTVSIQRGASGFFAIDYRTKVRPSDLTPGSTSGGRKRLLFDQPGYISAISVPDDNWTCTFADVNAQPVLNVCASDKRSDCK